MNSFLKLFSKIKNGILSKKNVIKIYYAKKYIKLLNILIKEGFIKNYKIISKQKIEIYLKYKNNKSVINNIIFLSKPGKYLYIKNKNLYKKKGFYILSTSFGLITNLEAKKKNIGGKLICEIY